MQQSEQIDALCDEWSEQWQCGGSPDLALFLSPVSPDLREAAVPFLVPLDVQLRRQRQPGLMAKEYAALGSVAMQLAEQCLRSEFPAEDRRQADGASAIFRFSDDDLPVAAAVPKPLPDLPAMVGEFRVVGTIGVGGMGVVVKGEHSRTRQPVAIKFLRPELSGSLEARRRFLREAAASGSVSHPHVVRVLRVEQRPQLCLVMEFVPGRTLDDRLRQFGTLPLSEILQLGLQITEGLQAIHRQGIVHRDLKPQNILLQEGAVLWARISDFGVARFPGDPQITQSGEIVGSAAWLSPEQAQEQPATQRSDLFSFGCLLYAMACGQSPFQRAGLMPTLMAVMSDNSLAVSGIRPDLPQELCRLIEWLLQKSPRHRPRSIDTVLRTLQRLSKTFGVDRVLLPTQFTGEAAGASQAGPLGRRGLLWSGVAAVVLPVLGGLLLRRGVPVASRSWNRENPPSTIDAVVADRRRPAGPRTPPLLNLDAAPEEAATVRRQWSELLQLPMELAGPAGLKFLLIPPLQLPRSLQTDDRSVLPAFYAATRPVSWQQFHSLLENETAALLLARLSNSQATDRHQPAACSAEQATACVRQLNGSALAQAWSVTLPTGRSRLAGRQPQALEWRVLTTVAARRPSLFAGLERPSDGFCCWLQPSALTEAGPLQVGEPWRASGAKTPKVTQLSAGLWPICSGEDLQNGLSSSTVAG